MQIYFQKTLSDSAYKKIRGRIYSNDPCYRDSLSSLFRLVTATNGAFSCRTRQQAIFVNNDADEVCAFALLLLADGFPGTAQLCFFESLPDSGQYVADLIESACIQAKRWGAGTLLAGMNGHVNYGLGFLTSHFGSTPCFGSSYNPGYYPDYFRSLGFTEKRLVSYSYDSSTFSMEKERNYLGRITRRFTFRKADFSRLREEIRLYSTLNNQCFADHPLYFHRHADEDYELFKPFHWFLREENLLIAEEGNRAVGFLLWYPDFNELLGPGCELGLRHLLKYKLFRYPVRKFKIAEIGVIPGYQGSGVLLGLFHLCFSLILGRFQRCETGWIFDTNEKSKTICERWQATPFKTYSVFSRRLQ